MLKELIILILLTLAPGLELRASLPYGILVAHMSWLVVLAASLIANILIGPLVYWFLDLFVKQLQKIDMFARFWQGQVEKAQKKLKPSLDKYGTGGLAVFIGIPLPGTGVYSGAIAAYILGMNFRQMLIGTIAGVLIAGAIVALVVWSGSQAFYFLIKA